MTNVKRYSILTLWCCLLSTALFKAQNTYIPEATGYVNFNMGTSTFKHNTLQTLSLIGCNTNLTVKSNFWKGKTQGLLWETDNQVIPGIPVGHQKDTATGKSFYVSKYYIASPPVVKAVKKHTSFANDPKAQFDIGIVTPDAFTYHGEKPVQAVYMNYDILKPMHVEYFKVNYDPSFEALGVNFVPFNVKCDDFPWLDQNGITNATGASGIGSVSKTDAQGGFFLPYYFKTPTDNQSKTILDCEVTLLNDVLFHYEVFFVVNGVKQESPTLNLRDYYNTYGTTNGITLCCEYREELPCGCKPPEQQDPYRE